MAANGPEQASKQASNKLFLVAFDARKQSDREALNKRISAGIGIRDEENKELDEIFSNQVEWLKKYANSPEFLSIYEDKRSLEVMAEATFWSVNLGLDDLIKKMSYAEIREFQPLAERWGATERTQLIDAVCKKLSKPAFSHEASYALGQAAWAIYVHHHSYAKMIEEQDKYDGKEESSTDRTRIAM